MSTADVRIFDCVEEVLSSHLGQADSQSYLNEIRRLYYSKHLKNLPYRVVEEAISNCRTCTDASSAPTVGWWNWQDCDLLIVTSNTFNDERFSSELGGLLKDAGFSSAFCGAIGVTKCSFGKIQPGNIENCKNYVYEQIDIAKPKAIAILGADAYQLFKISDMNYTASIGQSWFWGIYKIFSLPSSRDFEDVRWNQILSRSHDFIYGQYDEILDV